MARVTGIGGVFFKAQDPKALAAWYQIHLGIDLADFGGSIFMWPDDPRKDKGLTVWHVAQQSTEWFAPSPAPFMINYRVDDLDGLLANLQAAGVEMVGEPESHPNGRFAWIMDPERNKLELWEPRPFPADPPAAE